MPFVERRGGIVVGLFKNLQPGTAEELLADNHADVVAFRNPPPTPRAVARNAMRARPDASPITVKDLKDIKVI